MGDDFKTAQPVEYYKKFVEQDVRPDGRELGACRRTVCNLRCITTADGSALVKLGNTTIMCAIKGELAAPSTEYPNRGYFVPNVELSPLCSPRFRSGPPGEQAQVASQFVLEVLENSKCIDLETLCVESGKLVWVLHCDLICLDFDGNILDACVLSLLAALKTTCLPKMKLNEDTDKYELVGNVHIPLNLLSQPVSTTFSFLDNQILFVDPTAEEESLSTGTVTIVTTSDKVCMVHKPGGTPMLPSQFQHLFDRAFERQIEIHCLIDETMSSVER